MAGDAFKKVATGDELAIAADLHNQTIDCVLDWRRKGKHAPKTPNQELPTPEGLKYVQNISDKDVPRFGILSITDVLFDDSDNLDEFKNNAAFVGNKPDSTLGPGQFMVAYEPIAKNEVGRAWVFGVCPVQIKFAGADDQFADVLDNDNTQLQSGGSGGALVLWKQNGTGTQWAMVRIGAGGALPTGQYQYMVLQVGVQNGPPVYDWERAHPLL